MKQLAQSTFVLLSLVTLVVISWFNSCQIDGLEAQVLQTQREIRELAKSGVMVSTGGGRQGPAAAPSGAGAGWQTPEEIEALKDPANLLEAFDRPYVTAKQVVRGGTLRRIIGQDPRGLNPFIANGADVDEYSRYVIDTLALRHPDNPDKFAPGLALKITSPDDGLTYVIHLRHGVMWQRPTVDWQSGRYDWLRGDHELTADDFMFAMEIIENPQVAGRVSNLRNYFEHLDRVEKLDRYTFKIVFKERQFMTRGLVFEDIDPMPRWLYQYDEDGQKFDDATWGLKLNEHWYNQKMIGTGPYRFVDWTPGVKLELERNPRYWGEPPAFDRVVMHIVKDQNAFPRKIRTKEIDITRLQPEQYRTEILEAKGPILGSEHIKVKRQPTLGYFYLGWNLDTKFFSDKRVRQAMTMALNRKDIIESVFHGLGTLTTGPFAQQSPCYDKSIEPWPFDLKAAAARLEAAGWIDADGDGVREKTFGGEKVNFEFSLLIYGSSTEFQTIANIYREDLLQIGVKMNARAVEWSTMLKKMDEREFDVYTGAWVLGWDTDLFQIWHSKEADRPKGSNRIGFRNKEGDRIAEQLRLEFDPVKRQALCHAFHKLVHEEQPYTFIYQRERPVVYWDHLNEPEFSLIWPYRDIRFWSFREARP